MSKDKYQKQMAGFYQLDLIFYADFKDVANEDGVLQKKDKQRVEVVKQVVPIVVFEIQLANLKSKITKLSFFLKPDTISFIIKNKKAKTTLSDPDITHIIIGYHHNPSLGLHHSSSNESSSSQLSDSALEENRSCFKQVFNLNKEVGDTMDYAFETVRCEICELTGKKIGKGTVKSFYYGEGDSKFNIVMSIMRWVDDKEITNSLNNNNASSTNNLECDKNRDSEIYGQWDFFLRKCTEWNITEFLNESKEEPFQLKIGLYLKSLETINDIEQGKRQKIAKQLLNNYRKGSDDKIAKKWERERSRVLHIHQPMIVDGTINGAVNSGTIGIVGNINVFVAGPSEPFESKKDREKDFNIFFQSPSKQKSTNPVKKRRRSEIIRNEQGISNKKKDKAEQESIPTSEEVYKVWFLSNGKCVEDTIYEHCKQLPVETYLHSWIIDLDDQEVEMLFSVEEWNEIRHTVRELPEVDRTFAESMIRFSNVKATSELRQVLKTTSFLNEGEPYNREKHYDAEWAELVMRKFLTDYEDPNEPLKK
ncbi:hypothetical protein GLOIN_2v1552276 [Rhizophagus clarus]|uniref:Uncharacterized protein n=1 Tax=Rhizophagus clarus TaxID=94130 RepID=A0A8H3MAV4_9GLOM|nr:hypothetical protein GLOIN_2v1552276 [Rhizophagus clarus]